MLIRSILRSAIPVLALGAVVVVVATLFNLNTDATNFFPLGVASAAAALAIVGGARQWQKFPVAPLGGIAFSSVGYLMNEFSFMMIGFFIFGILTIWHEHKLERKLRSSNV